MIPNVCAPVDGFPLTPSGKVDRGALPAPDRVRSEMEESFVAPRTSTESVIAEIWQDLLNVDQISVYDNFFDLGGHSLLAMRVVAGLEKKLGLRINPRELILQTLGQLAASCEERTHLQSAQSIPFTQKLWHTVKGVFS